MARDTYMGQFRMSRLDKATAKAQLASGLEIWTRDVVIGDHADRFLGGMDSIMRFRSGLRLATVLGTAALLPLAVSGVAVAAHSPGRVFKGTKSVLTAA